MAYTDDSGTVITQAGELLHKSFNRLSGTIQSTETKIGATYATSAGVFNDNAGGDEFGRSVAVRSGVIAVGAPFEDSAGYDAGAVYVHNLDGTGRGLYGNAKFYGFADQSGDNFGHSVAVGSGTVVFGGPEDGSLEGSITFTDAGRQSTNSGGVRRRPVATLSVDNANAVYGTSVAVGSGRIVVGSPGDRPYIQARGGFQQDVGAVYIYDINGDHPYGSSSETLKIFFHDTSPSNDKFGTSVAAGCGRIVVGAPSNGLTNVGGRAYIYDLDGNLITEIEAKEFEADGTEVSNQEPNARFGFSVAVGSGRIVVGAPFYDGSPSTILAIGVAYIYDLNGKFIQKIRAVNSSGTTDADFGDQFGYSVAVGSGKIVIGAPNNDDGGSNSGSAYIFDLDGTDSRYIEKIVASDDSAGSETNKNYGKSVAVGSGKIVIGAPGDVLAQNFLGTNIISGSAYIYDLDENYDIYIERQLGY
jgi:hypothetical protein